VDAVGMGLNYSGLKMENTGFTYDAWMAFVSLLITKIGHFFWTAAIVEAVSLLCKGRKLLSAIYSLRSIFGGGFRNTSTVPCAHELGSRHSDQKKEEPQSLAFCTAPQRIRLETTGDDAGAEVDRYLATRSLELSSLKCCPAIKQLYIKLNTGLSASAAVERLFPLVVEYLLGMGRIQ
jgi:hypothetical protein